MPQDPNAPDYSQQTLAAVYQVVPDQMPDGTAVNFLSTYLNSVTYQEAFPAGDQPQELLPYVAFQIWGRPLSPADGRPQQPQHDLPALRERHHGLRRQRRHDHRAARRLLARRAPHGPERARRSRGGGGGRPLRQPVPGRRRRRPPWRGPTSCPTATWRTPSRRRPRRPTGAASTATFAGAPLQAPSPDYGVSVFVWGEQAATARTIDQVKDLGFNWVRQLFQWRDIEGADKGQFDWAEADRVVKAANDAGVKIIARLDFAPDWTQAHAVPNGPPDDIERLRRLRQRLRQPLRSELVAGRRPCGRHRGLERAEPGPRVGRQARQPGPGGRSTSTCCAPPTRRPRPPTRASW